LKETVKNSGYTLFELLVVIVIVSIIASVALRSLKSINNAARAERTKEELNQLAYAIAGDPNMYSGGIRIDFGYIGDVGSMPPNLDALVKNTSGLASWNGPYLHDDYLISAASNSTGFKTDEWGANYSYSGGNTISSNGTGSAITRQIANSVDDLLYNAVAITITDINQIPPGAIYKDSVAVNLTLPNGAGGNVTISRIPTSDGFARIDSVPIGQHELEVIYQPLADTLKRKVTVNPGMQSNINLNLFVSFGGTTPPTGSSALVIRPNGPGTFNEINLSGCLTNWQCLSENVTDNDASYVESTLGIWSTDTYALENPAVTGTIDSIIVKAVVRNSSSGQVARTTLVVNGKLYNGSNTNLNPYGSYAVISTTYILNPETSSVWKLKELNDLQAGVAIKDPGRCTQVWVEIYQTS
jgi:prepilin-type N-terminal cleavage/methylation domain-containing protein